MRCVGTKGKIIIIKEEPCRGLKGRCDFLILLGNFLFIITLPDSRVYQLLMNLLLSHLMLQLIGGPQEAGAGISKEFIARCSSWVAARVSKLSRSQREEFFKMRKYGCLLGGFSRTWAFLTEIQHVITKYLRKSAVHLTPLVSLEGSPNALNDALPVAVICFTTHLWSRI